MTTNTKKDQFDLHSESISDSELLSQSQAAKFLRLSEHALQSWRTTGRYALPFTKCGRRVFYTAGALRAFMASRTFTHTQETKNEKF